jgi:hypothetical protein
VCTVGEPGDVADLDQQPGRTRGTDAVQFHQRGADGGDQLLQFLVGGLLALVEAVSSGALDPDVVLIDARRPGWRAGCAGDPDRRAGPLRPARTPP